MSSRLVLLALVFAVLACAPSPRQPAPQEAAPAQVPARYLREGRVGVVILAQATRTELKIATQAAAPHSPAPPAQRV